MSTKGKREPTPMEKLTAGYEDLMKGKQVRKDGGSMFKKALKKAATPKKSRDAK